MISIVAAMDQKRGIGHDNELLFKIPEDFERVKSLTIGHPIIMGRNTFESLGRKLPDRIHIVITSNPLSLKDLNYQSDITVLSLDEAITQAQNLPGSDEIFIFGGGQVFAEALDKGVVDKLYLTIVEGEFGADTFFPDYSMFGKVLNETKGKSGGYKYRFIDLEK